MYDIALYPVLHHIMEGGDIAMRRKRRLRRLWYYRKRNLKGYRLLLYITTIILSVILLWIYVCVRLFPEGLVQYEDQLNSEVRYIVDRELEDENFSVKGYGGIVEIERDSYGKAVSAKADNIKLNSLGLILEQNLKRTLAAEEDKRFTALKADVLPVLNYEARLGSDSF